MRDHEEYRLVSVRRRFGGLFDRERLLGRQIRTKNLESLEPGAFILARMQIVHGACAQVAEEMRGGAVSKSYVQFVGREGTDIGFFARLAQTPEMLKLYMDASQGVVIEKMTFDLKRWLGFKVNLPPLPEQRRIAEILDTVDEAIRKTEEIIAKLKQVKQGLLHDLLTRGIDEHGELRDPDRHPEQFKDSPLGRIPKAWDVVTLGQGIDRSPQNGLYKPGTDYGDTGTPIVRIDGFYDGPIAPIGSLKRVRLAEVERATYCLSPGDLLVNRVNSIDYVGKVGLVPTNLATTVVFESNLMRVVVDRGCLHPEFALHWLCSPQAKAHFHSRAKNAIAQASVNQTDIVDLPVLLPSLEEQRLIVHCVSQHAKRESAEEAQDRKLRLLKQGLMEDLLTGRVRVTSLLEAAAE